MAKCSAMCELSCAINIQRLFSCIHLQNSFIRLAPHSAKQIQVSTQSFIDAVQSKANQNTAISAYLNKIEFVNSLYLNQLYFKKGFCQ